MRGRGRKQDLAEGGAMKGEGAKREEEEDGKKRRGGGGVFKLSISHFLNEAIPM